MIGPFRFSDGELLSFIRTDSIVGRHLSSSNSTKPAIVSLIDGGAQEIVQAGGRYRDLIEKRKDDKELRKQLAKNSGLMNSVQVKSFAHRAADFFDSEWTSETPQPTANERLLGIGNITNEALDSAQLPGIKSFKLGSGNFFLSTEWSITLDDVFFHIDNLTTEQEESIVNSAYHEARHSEQSYRVAKVLASQPIGLSDFELTSRHSIDPDIAKQATSAPYHLNPQKVDPEAYLMLDTLNGKLKTFSNTVNAAIDTFEDILNEASETIQRLNVKIEEIERSIAAGRVQNPDRVRTAMRDRFNEVIKRVAASHFATNIARNAYAELPEEIDAHHAGDVTGNYFLDYREASGFSQTVERIKTQAARVLRAGRRVY